MKEHINNAEITTLMPHLHVVTIGADRVIFSRTRNIGYIEGKTMFIKDDFYPGGPLNNVYFNQDFELVRNTFQLDRATTERNENQIAEAGKVLGDLSVAISKEKDKVKAQAIFEKAQQINEALNNAESNKTFSVIRRRFEEITNPQPVEEHEAKAEPKKEEPKKPAAAAATTSKPSLEEHLSSTQNITTDPPAAVEPKKPAADTKVGENALEEAKKNDRPKSSSRKPAAKKKAVKKAPAKAVKKAPAKAAKKGSAKKKTGKKK